MEIGNVLASIAVKDLAAAMRWYERVLGRRADSTPMPGVAEWKFPRGGWLQVYEMPERAGGGSCTLVTDDLKAVGTELRRLGLDIVDEMNSDKAKVIMVADPSGNLLAFAQPLDTGMAR